MEETKTLTKKILTLKSPSLFIFSARRNSGKSHLITFLLYNKVKEFNHVFVMCPTSFNGHYQKYLNKSSIISNFDEEIINKLFDRQKQMLADKTKRKEKILLILDDCLSSSTFKSPTFQRIAAEGRHYLIECWISTQHYSKLPPIIRLNSDYIFILGNQTKNIQTLIFDEFGGGYDDFNKFSARLRDCTTNYGAFVINNLDNGNDYGIRAPAKLPNFRITNKKRNK